jgi:peptidoglycan/LPS O-acetylase OafA/YrhL
VTTIYEPSRGSASGQAPLAAPVKPGQPSLSPPAPSAATATVSATPTGSATTTAAAPPLAKHDLPVLEGFRGLAAIMVVVTHVGFTSGVVSSEGAWAGWLSRLDFGVALFFLLSGFLLFRPFIQAAYGTRPAVDVRSYIRRRYVRIYPALLLVLVANYLLMPEARDEPLSLWVETLFLVQNYPNSFLNQLPGLVQTWSLVVEVSFYLLLPGLAYLVLGGGRSLATATARLVRQREQASSGLSSSPVTRRAARTAQRPSAAKRLLGPAADPVVLAAMRPAIVLGAFTLLAITWRTGYSISSNGYGRQLLWLPAFLDWFAAGMALAWIRERPMPVPQPIRILANMPGVCWSLCLAGYWLVTTEKIGGPFGLEGATTASNIAKHLIYLVLATLMLLPAIFGDSRAGWRTTAMHPVMTWLGQISFGVFLWHPMLMETAIRVLRIPPFTGKFWLILVLTLASSLVAGTLSWKYLEEPAQRRWRNGFRARNRDLDRDRLATPTAS